MELLNNHETSTSCPFFERLVTQAVASGSEIKLLRSVTKKSIDDSGIEDPKSVQKICDTEQWTIGPSLLDIGATAFTIERDIWRILPISGSIFGEARRCGIKQ